MGGRGIKCPQANNLSILKHYIKFLKHLINPPGIIGDVFLMLRVNGIDLPVGGGLGEEGGEEELREPVQRPAQVVRADIEIVVGVVA